ncbi:uncharacterized protein ACOB8E_013360 isoform 2-T7 [Sarcophilus harrisii]
MLRSRGAINRRPSGGETQAELEQRCSQIQQLTQDLEAGSRLQKELHRQFVECNRCLIQAEGETRLRTWQLEQTLQAEEMKTQLNKDEVEEATRKSQCCWTLKKMGKLRQTR